MIYLIHYTTHETPSLALVVEAVEGFKETFEHFQRKMVPPKPKWIDYKEIPSVLGNYLLSLEKYNSAMRGWREKVKNIDIKDIVAKAGGRILETKEIYSELEAP